MSGYLLKFKQTYSVKIGGRRYPVVKIGNQLWMAENLDWKWTNLTIGGSYVNDGNPHAWYYNNDETTYGVNGNKYGLLYNGYALQNIIDGDVTIPDGWHIPSYNEFSELLTTVGSSADLKLKSKTGWNNDKNGNDDYGFCAYPCGNIVTTGYPYGPAYIGEQIMIYNTSAQLGKNGTLYIDYLSNVILGHGNTSFGNASSIRLVSFDYGKVIIGGRDYKTIKIGNQEWLAENLDYKFQYNGSTLPIGPSGTPSTPAAWYYNNDESTYGIDGTYKCGLLYNWYAAKYLDDNKSTLLPDGWHVPSRTEFDTLAIAVGGTSVAGTKLKALDNSIATGFPSGWNGTDEYGFKALPAGDRLNGSFDDFGTYCNFWSNYEYSSSHGYNYYITSASALNNGYAIKSYAISIRLVKSLT